MEDRTKTKQKQEEIKGLIRNEREINKRLVYHQSAVILGEKESGKVDAEKGQSMRAI